MKQVEKDRAHMARGGGQCGFLVDSEGTTQEGWGGGTVQDPGIHADA